MLACFRKDRAGTDLEVMPICQRQSGTLNQAAFIKPQIWFSGKKPEYPDKMMEPRPRAGNGSDPQHWRCQAVLLSLYEEIIVQNEVHNVFMGKVQNQMNSHVTIRTKLNNLSLKIISKPLEAHTVGSNGSTGILSHDSLSHF